MVEYIFQNAISNQNVHIGRIFISDQVTLFEKEEEEDYSKQSELLTLIFSIKQEIVPKVKRKIWNDEWNALGDEKI